MTIETTGGECGYRWYVPIVDPDVVLRRKKVFIVVQECWDRNSTVYGGSKSAEGHDCRYSENKTVLVWCGHAGSGV